MNLNVDIVSKKTGTDEWSITGSISDVPINVIVSDDFQDISSSEQDCSYGSLRNTLNLLLAQLKKEE
jgi:hypothetical protein